MPKGGKLYFGHTEAGQGRYSGGVGTFEVRDRAERKGETSNQGRDNIPASKAPVLKQAKP